jgi:hypothetical protein
MWFILNVDLFDKRSGGEMYRAASTRSNAGLG